MVVASSCSATGHAFCTRRHHSVGPSVRVCANTKQHTTTVANPCQNPIRLAEHAVAELLAAGNRSGLQERIRPPPHRALVNEQR